MFQLGTVSEGALLTEDLLDSFASTLEQLARQEPQNRAHLALAFQAQADFEDELISDEEMVNEILPDALQEYCPPFVYFGSHPGDGADFGFWPDLDGLQDALRYAEETDNVGERRIHDCACDSTHCGVLVQVNDHGNVTVMDMGHNKLWSCV